MKLDLLFFLNLCLIPVSTLAEEEPTELDEITVSGSPSTKPPFNQKPISKNSFSSRELTERGVNDVSEISRQIANFHTTDAGAGSFFRTFSMRGLTNTAILSVPATVFYVDDVPYSGAATTTGQLFQIDGLTVYRSSQPGLFGKNAYAGAVDIKTRQPENALQNSVALELGNFSQYKVIASSAGALLNDKLYFSVSGQYQQRDGFLYNSYLHTTPDNQESFSGHAMLKWTPSQAWDVRLTLTKENFDYGAARYVRLDSPDPYTVRSETAAQLKQRADSQALRIAYNNDNYELLSVTSRRSWQMNPNLIDVNLTPELFNAYESMEEKAWTQELRLRPKNSHSDWDWQAGFFYSNIAKKLSVHFIAPAFDQLIRLNKHQVDNYAVFGKFTYRGFSDVTPYFDLRLDYTDAKVNSDNTVAGGAASVLQDSKNSFFASPKLGVDVTLSPNAQIYLATGLAFKPAGYSNAALVTKSSGQYDKETNWHNELGLKSHWFNERFLLNLAAFYYKIDNYQLERFITATDYAILNTPKVHSYGFEVESQTKLFENLSLDLNFGYTRIQFDHYSDPLTHENYAGNIVPFVPDVTSLIALQYKDPQGYFARFEWHWTGTTYFDEHNTDYMKQNYYETINLRIGYDVPKYSIYVFANNIADNRYISFKYANLFGTPGDPRTFGIRMAVNF